MSYYKQMREAESCELRIEKDLLAFEKGEINQSQVQQTTNASLNVKYKAEILSQDYKGQVAAYNAGLARFMDEYQPILQQL